MKTLLQASARMFLALAILYLSNTFSLAQQSSTIQFLDQQSKEPIIGLSYRYGFQRGISDENGTITLLQDSESWLLLSHISYGTWNLDPLQVSQAIQSKQLFREESLHGLQPFSVISLKMSEEKDKKIVLSDQERLHHDAGAILALNPVVAGIRKGGSFAFDPVMRGFKYDQLNVVINGMQSANAACPNRMDPPMPKWHSTESGKWKSSKVPMR